MADWQSNKYIPLSWLVLPNVCLVTFWFSILLTGLNEPLNILIKISEGKLQGQWVLLILSLILLAYLPYSLFSNFSPFHLFIPQRIVLVNIHTYKIYVLGMLSIIVEFFCLYCCKLSYSHLFWHVLIPFLYERLNNITCLQ